MKRDLTASVQALLQNKAKASNRPYQEVLQHYGLERFLYRLSRSNHCDQFVLKGALMLRVWDNLEARPTRDIDFLAYAENSIELLVNYVQQICRFEVQDDGVMFDASTVIGERISEDADYQGVRIKFFGYLGRARIPMQLDIGFGDVVYPHVDEADYPALLDFPSPRLRVYPRETMIAEKFQAMVGLGSINSRMKDFYDIWLLSQRFDYEGDVLATAIAKTFEHRATELDGSPVAFSSKFMNSDAAQKQWTAFVRRTGIKDTPKRLIELQKPIREFLLPLVEVRVKNRRFISVWVAPGPWSTGGTHR